MTDNVSGYRDARVISSGGVDRPPAMGWLWSVIGVVLLGWLVALFIVGDDVSAGSDAQPAATQTAP